MRKKKKDIPVIEGFEITGVAAEGKSLKKLVPPAVEEYIKNHNLYRGNK